MKKTTAFGAVLCSAALATAMAIPAFAAPEVGVGGDGKQTSTTGSVENQTVVNLYGFDATTQLIATIPVDLTVSAPEEGGDLICPSSAAYKVTNGSTFDIKVASVKAVPGSASWNISTTALTPGINNLDTAYKKIALALSAGVDEYGNAAEPIYIAETSTALAADKFTVTANESLGLELSGSALPTKSGTTINKFSTTETEKAATLVYTVSK